ncbi:TPA: IS110 family transposase, partial [bacterium]|nr:IS110 family transposase [bacterium]
MVIKTEKVKFVNHKTLIATADIGKDSISCYLQGPQGQEVKPFRVSNEINGLTT